MAEILHRLFKHGLIFSYILAFSYSWIPSFLSLPFLEQSWVLLGHGVTRSPAAARTLLDQGWHAGAKQGIGTCSH